MTNVIEVTIFILYLKKNRHKTILTVQQSIEGASYLIKYLVRLVKEKE